MKTIFSLLAIAFLFFPFSGFSQKQTRPAKIEGWETYKEANCTFQYPQNWRMEITEGGTNFMLFAPKSKTNSINGNMNLRSEPAVGFSLEEYKDAGWKSIKESEFLQNIIMEKNSKGLNCGMEFCTLVYSGEYSGTKLNFLQRFYIINNRAYILTFTCSPLDIKKMQKIVTKIFDTFWVEQS